MPNPCRGIKGFKETGRKDVYIEDSVFNAVYEKSSQPLRNALDMAYLTGQRPADVPKMTERDISGADTLTVIQNKTNKKIRISIEGELAELINRILIRKSGHKIRNFALIVDDRGQRLTACALRGHFDRTRKAAGIVKKSFQLRDIRGKAGTDKTESTGDTGKLNCC